MPAAPRPDQPASLLQRLRQATRPAHDSLQCVPAFARLLAADLKIGEYTASLRHLHAFHAGLQPPLRAALQDRPIALALSDEARLDALAADLAWLGAVPDRPATAADLPPLRDSCDGLGVLYVLEGAALGGRVIARRLAVTLGIGPGNGGRFFGEADAATARDHWRHVCLLLEAAATDDAPVQQDRIIASACATFACLERWSLPAGMAAPLADPAHRAKLVTPAAALPRRTPGGTGGSSG